MVLQKYIINNIGTSWYLLYLGHLLQIINADRLILVTKVFKSP